MTKNVGLEVDLWGWVMFFFSPMSGVGHQNFVPLEGGGLCFFEEPGFHFLRPTPPPPLRFDQPLSLRSWRHVEQIQKEEKNWRDGGGGGDEKDRLPEN